MKNNIDLHTHTTSSDGKLTPEELIDFSVQKGLTAIAITDHDSIGAIQRARNYSKGKKIEIIQGVELGCTDPTNKYGKIDIVGLFIDYKSTELNEVLKFLANQREENKKKIIGKLNELGYEIKYEDVKKTVGGSFGRPHIAKFLLNKYPQEFKNVQEIFEKLIGFGKRAFVESPNRLSLKLGINAILISGGIPILAHPGIYSKEDSLEIIEKFISCGGKGIETYYPYYLNSPHIGISKEENRKIIEFYKSLAKSKNLIESGGSDYHGDKSCLGEIIIPKEVLENLKKRLK